MKMSEDRKEYLKEYRKNNLKRIPLDVSNEFYIRIVQHAALDDRTVNGYIKHVLVKAMAAEDAAAEMEEKTARYHSKLNALGDSMSGEK